MANIDTMQENEYEKKKAALGLYLLERGLNEEQVMNLLSRYVNDSEDLKSFVATIASHIHELDKEKETNISTFIRNFGK